MKIHPREALVKDAIRDIQEFFYSKCQDNCLTDAEKFRVAYAVFDDFTSPLIRDWIRSERHGDKDIPGGLSE